MDTLQPPGGIPIRETIMGRIEGGADGITPNFM